MADCSEEAIVSFVRERGGRVKNTDLIQHFRAVFPEDAEQRAAVRDRFKKCVDSVAVVKAEGGVKYVCLKKKFRGSLKQQSQRQPVDRRQVNDAQMGVAPPLTAGERQAAPRSCSGNLGQVPAPHGSSAAELRLDKEESRTQSRRSACVVEQVQSSPPRMGNTFQREKRVSGKEVAGPDIPQISVIAASPLPAHGSVFSLPGPTRAGSTGQVDTGPAGLRQTETAAELRPAAAVGQAGRQDSDDKGQCDTHSLSGSEGTSSPRCSRRHFIQVMMNRTPDLRRSLVLCPSFGLTSRNEAESASLVSALDEDRPSVSLEPLEHEWMMRASDGEWGSLHCLLTADPSLILRKDFVSGFTCLHWAAKHGKPELIALIVNFAKQHDVPVSVNVRSNTGYTPLHIAAMHNHIEVVKILVGAYGADVEIRDYSGRKACQYLTNSVSLDIRDIIGAYEQSEDTDQGDGGRWRFSKVLQSNLKPFRLLGPGDSDSVDRGDGPREKPLRRKSSLSRMKPKLQKLRMRTSQIVQSTSFHETDELSYERSMKDSFKSRPKTHFLG